MGDNFNFGSEERSKATSTADVSLREQKGFHYDHDRYRMFLDSSSTALTTYRDDTTSRLQNPIISPPQALPTSG